MKMTRLLIQKFNLLGEQSLLCARQGMMNTTGVAVIVPTIELNLSMAFPSNMQIVTHKAINIDLWRFIKKFLRKVSLNF
jgi:hypothetical protein